MKGPGFDDLGQIRDLYLQGSPNRDAVNGRMIDWFMAKKEGDCKETVEDRLEGEILISKAFEESLASNRHGFLLKAAVSAWGGMEKPESLPTETVGKATETADLVGAKLSGSNKLSDAGMLLNASELKFPGNFSRKCRICGKEFNSGRALGGHMRVHGPFYLPGSITKKRHGVSLSTRAEGADEFVPRDEDDDRSTSGIDSLPDAAELKKISPLQRQRDHGAIRALFPDAGNVDGYASEVDVDLEDAKDLNFNRLLSVNSDSQVSLLDEAEEPPARKSLLYTLRHNPKRSRWFADQEFAFDASLACVSDKFPLFEEGRRVCADCGKVFLTERALYGHMRCHSDRHKMKDFASNNMQHAQNMVGKKRKSMLMASDRFTQSSEIQAGHKKGEVAFEAADYVEASMEARRQVFNLSAEIGGVEVNDEVETENFIQSKRNCGYTSTRTNDEVKPACWKSSGRRSRRKRGLSKAGTALENRATSSDNEPGMTSETLTISSELGLEEQEIQTPPDFLILLADAARKIEEEAVLLSSKVKSAPFHSDATGQRSEEITDGDDNHLIGRDAHGIGEYEIANPWSVSDRQLACASAVKYECVTCKKSFSSHQALGGHRASHNKSKAYLMMAGSSEEQSVEEELGVLLPKKKKRRQMQQAAAFKGHMCSICNRIFPTGQALGGHKRCHWTGERPSESTSIASATKPLSLQSEGVGVCIDLNMPAPVDEDADEVGFTPTPTDEDADEVGFISAQVHSTDSKSSDDQAEVENMKFIDGKELVLSSKSALTWAVKDFLKLDRPALLQNSKNSKIEAKNTFDEVWGRHGPDDVEVTRSHWTT